jgi:hypothetical protein
MTLERHGHDGCRAVPVLGHDEVRLSCPRRLLLVQVLPVQEYDDVRVLLDAVVTDHGVCDEVVRALDRSVIDRLRSEGLDADDSVPVNVAACDFLE